jgi:hypothetical protein
VAPGSLHGIIHGTQELLKKIAIIKLNTVQIKKQEGRPFCRAFFILSPPFQTGDNAQRPENLKHF